MAFWGIEVKPGKPFSHSSDRVKGRLRISQATLGIGSSTKKSLVQCNIGDKSPVFLCALLPDKTESCHLDLEFEEADEVLFSVIGPRSVYLTGYYLASGGRANLQDDSESYGEDIAHSETEESNRSAGEDEYDDSFIDDGDLEASPPSPLSSGRVVDEEMLDTKKPKQRKGMHKRLKKKYQSIVSDDESTPWQNNMVNESKGVSGLKSEDEDKFPISSLYKGPQSEAGEKVYKELSKMGNKKTEDDGTPINDPKSKADGVVTDGGSQRVPQVRLSSLLQSNGVSLEDGFELKKQRKKRSSEEKTLKSDSANRYDSLKEDKMQHTEEKVDGIVQDLLVTNKQDQEPATDKKSKKKRKERSNEGKSFVSDDVNHVIALKDHNPLEDKAGDHKPATDKETDVVLSYDEAGSGNGPKPKRRRKAREAEGKSAEHNANYNYEEKQLDEDVKQHEGETCKNGKDRPVRIEQVKMLSNDERIVIDSPQIANGDQCEVKKTKKKKKSKILEDGGNVGVDVPSLPVEEKNVSVTGFEDKNVKERPSQGRTLSNGLIIEELEAGKPDGKIAAPRKKVKVHYVGKLRESGQIFDSNIGKAPLKFRLGAEDVIEGWNIGLEGMRVGDKRRLTIPPTMGYGSQGAGENIPPNSWLVYEVELFGVH